MEPDLKPSQEHNVAHYVKAIDHLRSGERVSADEPEVLSIAEKMRYFQQKYGQRIDKIMDIVWMAAYLKLEYPEESRDRDILMNMSDTIMESFDKQVSPNLPVEDTLGILEDPRARMRALIAQNKLYKAVLNSTSQGAWFIDREFHIRYTNNALCEMFGYSEEELLGRKLFDFFDGEDKNTLMKRAALMDVQEHRDYAIELARKDGTYLPVKIQATTIRVDGEVIGAVAFLSDVSEFHMRENELHKRTEVLRQTSITDALTKVYNRGFFDVKLGSYIGQLNEGKLKHVSLALIDADHFKKINDTYTHQVGDRVLKNIGELLLSIDIPGISVFRYGGEEFALIGKNIALPEMLKIAEDLRQKIAEMVVTFRKGSLQFTISIGIGTCAYEPGKIYETKQCLDSTDENLYAAKAAGRNCIVSPLGLYTPS